MEEEDKEIKILSTDDKKIKSFGELLTNDSSREILQILFQNELTALEIAQKTDVSLQLVKYHITKMQELEIVKISKVEKNTKNQDMNYYTATKFAVVIVPSEVSDRTKESKMLVRSFKTIYRMLGFGLVAAASWFVLATQQAGDVPMRGETVDETVEPLQIIIPIVIVIAGLVVEGVLQSRRKRH